MKKIGRICSGHGVTMLAGCKVVKQESLQALQREGILNYSTENTKGVHVSSPKHFVQIRLMWNLSSHQMNEIIKYLFHHHSLGRTQKQMARQYGGSN